MYKQIIFLILCVLSFCFSYWLKITEVYFDWNDEYIWIFNDESQDFHWTITFSGAKSTSIKLDLDIDKNQEIIVWDSWINWYFSWFTTDQTNLILSIPDSKEIDIKILSGTQVLDSFFVSKENVKKLNNKKTSFQKVFSKSDRDIDKVTTPVHMSNWYVWNPWFVVWIHEQTWQTSSDDQNNEDVWNSDDSTNSENIEVYTCYIDLANQSQTNYKLKFIWNKKYSNITWSLNNAEVLEDNEFFEKDFGTWNHFIQAIWNFENHQCTANFTISHTEEKTKENIFNWILQINEVHAADEFLPEYVELKAIWNLSWNFILDGFARWNSQIPLSLKLYSWNIVLLTKDKKSFKHSKNILEINNLSISDNWWILSIWQDGQVLDKVQYSSSKFVYFSHKNWDTRFFEKESQATPWYENFANIYQKTDASCKIIPQSYKIEKDKIKINLKTVLSSNNLCEADFQQIRTYSWWQINWTCNPNYIDLPLSDNDIDFKIIDKNWKTICSDTYKILFFQEKQSKDENLDCSIAIQNTQKPLFADDKINLISFINWQEIQNSNKHFTCKFSLSGQTLSNKCNPESSNFSWWIHNIKLEIIDDNWRKCNTSFHLNVPEVDTLIDKADSKQLKNIVGLIKNKYKTKQTLKKIFEPISYIYPHKYKNYDNDTNVEDCAKLNSTELRELSQKIKEKYKSNNTLKKIYNPINFLYQEKTKQTQQIFTGKLEIFSLMPNPIWSDSWAEILLLSWDFLSWLKIWNQNKKIKLQDFYQSWNIYIFTWSFWFSNTRWCYNLFYKNQVLDTKCYVQPEEWKFIEHFLNMSKSNFSWDYIFVNWEILENTPLIDLKKKLKIIDKQVNISYSSLQKENQKLQKKYEKTYNVLLKRLEQYIIYKQKYAETKQSFAVKNTKNTNTLRQKNKQIKNLNNIKVYLKSFIVHVKKHIPKDLYRQYLDNYKKVQKWQKIRF